MRVQQYQIAGLGHLSTLIVDDATGAAAVVDPRRDVDVYLEAAGRDDLRIDQVIETHLHNDYVSGGRELAALTGATHVIGAGADLRYDARGVRGGETRRGRRPAADRARHARPHARIGELHAGRHDPRRRAAADADRRVAARRGGRADGSARRGTRAGLLGRDVSLAPRRDPAARGLGRRSTRPTAPARCARPGSAPRPGRRSATSDATTRCSPRWRSTPSPARCSPASRPSRATSPGCARSTRPARACSAASSRPSRRSRWRGRRARRRRRPRRGRPPARRARRRPHPGLALDPARRLVRDVARLGHGPRSAARPRRRRPGGPRRTAAPGLPHRPRVDRRRAWTGGIDAWRAAGRPVERPRRHDRDELAARLAADPADRRSSSTSASRPSTTPATSRAPSTSAPVPSPTGSTSCRATGRSPSMCASGYRASVGASILRVGRIHAGRLGRGRLRCLGGRRPARSDVGRPAREAAAASHDHPRARVTDRPLSPCRSTRWDYRASRTGTEGGGVSGLARCEHRHVGAREPLGLRVPDSVGRLAAAPERQRDRVASVGPSVFRRLLGPSATDGPGGQATVTVQAPAGPPASQPADAVPRGRTRRAARLGPRHRRAPRRRRTIARSSSGRSSTRRSARSAPTSRRSGSSHDDRLELAAWAGLTDDVASRLPSFHRDEGWVGEVLRTGRVQAWPDVRIDPSHGYERYDGVLEFAGNLIAPLMHHDRVIGALAAVTHEPRDWTDGDVAFITTLATHAAIALTNAELFAQTEARAAQLAVLQAASARLSRAATVGEVGRTVVEETRRIIDYHNARVYLVETTGRRRPDRVRGDGRGVRAGRPRTAALPVGRGVHRLGRRARPAAPHPRRERRPARRDHPGHRRGRRIDAHRPDALRRGDGRGHHALEAGAGPVRRRRPAAAHDPRRPGRHGGRVGPAARPGRRTSPASCAGCST